MDKQDAIDFIVQEYEGGRSPSEIAGVLSERLGAPVEVVSRFVSRTLEQRQSFLNAAPEAPPAPQPPSSPHEASSAFEPNGPGKTPEFSADEVDPAHTGEATDRVTADLRASIDAQLPAQLQAATLDPRLEKFIFDELGKDRKERDIIMAVCERTGMDWQDAQRAVERIAATQNQKIVSRRNRLVIPFSLTFIALGLGLTYAGVNEFLQLTPFVNAIEADGLLKALRILPAIDFSRNAFWALGLGMALILGGLTGLIQAIRAGMA